MLLRSMQPERRFGEWVFVTVDALPDGLSPAATVTEAEGLSCVITRQQADVADLDYDFVAAWITLNVHSALAAVGLTAAVAVELARHELSCNVIAGRYHDHLLVPFERADEALNALVALSQR